MSESQERFIKTTVKVPISLYRKYKHLEIDNENDEKVADLIIHAMERYVATPKAPAALAKEKEKKKSGTA